ncbi:hypothetical protein PIB30_028571 [Stylosanthes scabra]|uniref:Uncharacterized protein n=1 Tax=Stylosanthes scabra TaxID=79078 RepID=A0ABU6U9V1_9FABA|nr:hypothetical protein [Stylosanthes scabra]
MRREIVGWLNNDKVVSWDRRSAAKQEFTLQEMRLLSADFVAEVTARCSPTAPAVPVTPLQTEPATISASEVVDATPISAFEAAVIASYFEWCLRLSSQRNFSVAVAPTHVTAAYHRSTTLAPNISVEVIASLRRHWSVPAIRCYHRHLKEPSPPSVIASSSASSAVAASALKSISPLSVTAKDINGGTADSSGIHLVSTQCLKMRDAVKVRTEGNDILRLCYELRLLFVNWIISNQKSSYRRYVISSVYRKAVGNLPPNENIQGDFDIIGGTSMLTEADVIKVTRDIVTCFFHESSLDVYLNHGQLMEAICSWIGVNSQQWFKVSEICVGQS